jgi:hypothetical protein
MIAATSTTATAMSTQGVSSPELVSSVAVSGASVVAVADGVVVVAAAVDVVVGASDVVVGDVVAGAAVVVV